MLQLLHPHPTVLQFATFKNNKELKKSDGAKRQRILGEEASQWANATCAAAQLAAAFGAP